MADLVPSCIFCQIIEKKAPASIVYEDEAVIIFTDIHPAAKCHFLVVPKRHIKNASVLKTEDRPLVESLRDHARAILEEKGADLEMSRLGFHWPPFNSVNHLHLHAIAPTTDLGILSRMIFKPNSYWFVSPDYVLQRLE